MTKVNRVDMAIHMDIATNMKKKLKLFLKAKSSIQNLWVLIKGSQI